jgi:serine/threonine protein kinase
MRDRYEIRSKIAQGGLGAVYVAYDRNLDRDVALKRVLPEALGEDPNAAIDLIKEARVLSALQHPNIVTVYDVGQDDKGPYVVMELLKGETLDHTIKRGALPQADFEQLVTQCLEGLVAAQAVGLVHRDLKPANIMVIWHATGKFQLKILDFGLAKLSKHPSKQTIDQSDTIMGSIYFMAPEQFERAELDGRVDLYTMGAIFYYTLTTQYPYQGDNAPQVMAAHLTHNYLSLEKVRPDLPAWIGGWLDWLMSRQAKHRPADAREALAYFREEKFRSEEEREAFAVEHEKKLAAQKAAEQQAAAQKSAEQHAAAAPESAPSPPGGVSSRLITGNKRQPTRSALASGQGSAEAADAVPVVVEEDDVPVAQAVVADDDVAVAVAVEEERPETVTRSTPTLATGADAQHAISVQGFVVDEEDETARKPKVPRWIFITIPLILLGGGIPALISMSERKAYNARIARVTELNESATPEGTAKDVEILLGFLEDGEDGAGDYDVMAASILSRLQGDGVDEAMCQGISGARGDGRKNLLIAIGMRGYSEGVPYLLKELQNPKAGTHLSAWNALGMVARGDDVPAMIAAMDAINTGDEAQDKKQRRFASEAITSVCEDIKLEAQRAKAVMDAVSNVENDETRKALLLISGRLSTPQVLERLKVWLRDSRLGIDAARAIGEWKDTGPMEVLLTYIKESPGDSEKLVALQSMAAITMRPSSRPHARTIALLAEAYQQVPPKRPRERNVLLNVIAQLPDPSAKPTLQRLGGAEFKNQLPTYVAQNAKMLAGVVPVAGPTVLGAEKAMLLGEGARLTGAVIGAWRGLDSSVKWEVSVAKPGKYSIAVTQSSEAAQPGRYRLMVADAKIEGEPKSTGSTTAFEKISMGSCKFSEAGNYSIWLQPLRMPGDNAPLMELKGIELVPK